MSQEKTCKPDKPSFLLCFKEQVNYFINSFGELSPHKKTGVFDTSRFEEEDSFSFKNIVVDGKNMYEDENESLYDEFTYNLLLKINSLKEWCRGRDNNNSNSTDDINIEEVIKIVSMIITLYNKYSDNYNSDKPEYKCKITHKWIYQNYSKLCVLFNTLSFELENKRKMDSSPMTNHEYNNTVLGSIFQKIIGCIKTHTIYHNLIKSRRGFYRDYYKKHYTSSSLLL